MQILFLDTVDTLHARVLAQVGLARSARLLIRNKQFLQAHLMQDIVMGLIVGSLFWKVSPHNFQVKIGAALSFSLCPPSSPLSVRVCATAIIYSFRGVAEYR